MKEYFRGVVWPREPKTACHSNEKVHRYIIVGMLVTDEPIVELEGNQFIVDGNVLPMGAGFGSALRGTYKTESSRPLGDASDVLLNLQHIVSDDEEDVDAPIIKFGDGTMDSNNE